MTLQQLGRLDKSQRALIVKSYQSAGGALKKMSCDKDCESCAGGIRLPIPGAGPDGLALCLVLTAMETTLSELASAVIREDSKDPRPSLVKAEAAR